MLSPLELENKRIMSGKRKYDRFEMDEYLDMVFENYKALYNENEDLKKQIKTLTEGIQYYRNIESTMQKALVLAEKTSKETKDAAVLKAEAIEKEANNKAAQIVDTAEQEYTRIREKCLALVQQFNNYKAQLQVAANEQLKLITSATFEVETPEIEQSGSTGPISMPGVEAVSPTAPEPEPKPEPAPSAIDLEPTTVNVPEPELKPEPEAIPSAIEQMEQHAAASVTPVPVTEAVSEPKTTPVMNANVVEDAPAEHKGKSTVYSYSSTQPIPKITPEMEAKAMAEKAAQADVSPAVTTIPVADPVAQSEPDATAGFDFTDNAKVPDKTMILPDVNEAAKAKKPAMTDDETMAILNAETIDLGDSIRAAKAKEQEILEVPEKTPTIELEPAAPEVAPQPQGLDSILQNMTIGKKKKSGNDSGEDPFEFLGSVDDF